MKLKDTIVYAIGKAEGLKEGGKASVVELSELNKYFIPGYRMCISDSRDDRSIILYRTGCFNGITCPGIISLHINMLDKDQIAALIVTAYQMHVKKCKNEK